MRQANRQSSKIRTLYTRFQRIDWQPWINGVKYKLAPITQRWQQLPRLHQRGLMILGPLLVVVMLWPVSESVEPEPTYQPARRTLEIDATPLSQQEKPAVEAAAKPQTLVTEWQTHQVKKGETLATIFRANALPLTDLYAVAAIEGKSKPLSKIKAGQLLRYKQTEDGDLDAIQIETSSGTPAMFFRRSDGSFAKAH